MICKNCGHYNWPYISECKRCGSKLYADLWKGRRLREIFIFTFILCSFFMIPVFFKFIFSKLSLIPIIVGIIGGLFFGFYVIVYLKKKIVNNTYLSSDKSKNILLLIIGISISLFYIIMPILAEDIFNSISVALITACWSGLLFSFFWLILYERKNGHVFIK